MWATAHNKRDRQFLSLSIKVLNKVIHRPVESLEISKIIRSLASIVMFHFNYATHGPMLRLSSCTSAACGGCVN
ncbi:hypothetical protein AWB69_04077 [Caballeronia udeis]|uniref:Uncharacterized protein n=1 Tax=Caballeronia udeis TaxID=1232866 RepID=A0A158H8Y5_9BURK|nr:hypothetical protein AWB69_04077 [Caballeronia udeis]